MFPSSSYTKKHSTDETLFPFWQKSENDVVDDLLLTIQNIVAGTAIVSNKMLSETCIECKLQLSSKSPVVILQYELESEHIECVPMMPLVNYEELDETSGMCNDYLKSKHDGYEITSDLVKENSSPICNSKHFPEHLSGLSSAEEIKETQMLSVHSLQENQNTACISQSNSIINIYERVDSSSGRERVSVSASDSDVTDSQIKPTNESKDDAAPDENAMENLKNQEIDETEEMAPFTKNSYFCSHCEKSFETKREKYWHPCSKSFLKASCPASYKTDPIEKPFSCPDCGKSYTSSSNLKVHKRTHTGEKPYTCRDCDKSFIRLDSLVRHQRIHTGERSFICEYCGKSFIQSGHLSLHKRTHTGDKDFTCRDCGKSFFRIDSLIRHRRVHTGEKPFTCKDCGKSFTTSSVLSKHKRIHTREKHHA